MIESASTCPGNRTRNTETPQSEAIIEFGLGERMGQSPLRTERVVVEIIESELNCA